MLVHGRTRARPVADMDHSSTDGGGTPRPSASEPVSTGLEMNMNPSLNVFSGGKLASRAIRWRLAAALGAAAVTTCGGLALAPAALADSTGASATPYSATHSPAAHPDTGAQCQQILIIYGYTVNAYRGIACGIGGLGGAAHIASCLVLMKGSGVSASVSALACATAGSPG